MGCQGSFTIPENPRTIPRTPAEPRRTLGETPREAREKPSERLVSSESLTEGRAPFFFDFVSEICSSAEVELMALGSGLNESIHIMQLIKEVQHGMKQHIFDIRDHTGPQPHPVIITLHTDSTSASFSASKLGVNKRSRHISLKYVWLQDEYKKGVVNITRVPTSDNPADFFTKLLPAPIIQRHLGPCGLHQFRAREG